MLFGVYAGVYFLLKILRFQQPTVPIRCESSGIFFVNKNDMIWLWPPPSSSDHQDYYIFNRESRTKPSFATGILGGGHIKVSLEVPFSPFLQILELDPPVYP